MSAINAAITCVGGYVPDYIMTNKELEKIVDTTDDWITTRTGIKERRILKGEGKATSDMGAEVVKQICEKRGISPEEIDLVLVATVTPDMPFPSTSNIICDKVGASNAWGFDLSAACSGFLYALVTGQRFIESGAYKKVVVVGADKMSSIINYDDRTTCIIFGDGGGAVLFEPSSSGYGWEDEYFRSNGTDRMSLKVKAGGSLFPTTQETLDKGWHYIYQNGKTVFKNAVSEMSTVAEVIMKRNGLDENHLDYFVPHQANKRIIDATTKRLALSKDKVLMNIEHYGNTTAATIPLLLNDNETRFNKGDKLVFTAFGGGFTWGAAHLTWAY
jgi:3-oxoacyl-[acyl-carrier-protein] synthase-3